MSQPFDFDKTLAELQAGKDLTCKFNAQEPAP